jgi:hypothetical protein
VQLATLAPDSPAIHVYDGEQFHVYQPESTLLPQVAASVDWYRGWRDHLGFAAIKLASPATTDSASAKELEESRS